MLVSCSNFFFYKITELRYCTCIVVELLQHGDKLANTAFGAALSHSRNTNEVSISCYFKNYLVICLFVCLFIFGCVGASVLTAGFL